MPIEDAPNTDQVCGALRATIHQSEQQAFNDQGFVL